jgi:thiol-disulfide isomerase/thioredoxin
MNQVKSTTGSQKIKKIVLMVLATSTLVIFPLLALYMSSSGLKAYKSLKAEMKAYRDSLQVPDMTFFSALNEQRISIASVGDKVLIAHFYDPSCKDCDSIWTQLNRVHDEFIKKTKRVQIFTYALQFDSTAQLKSLISNKKLDTLSWTVLHSPPEQMSDFLKKIKLDSTKAPYYFVLIDRKGIIANYYDARKPDEVNNMMKHATILLPAKEDRKKIKFKREKDVYQEQ